MTTSKRSILHYEVARVYDVRTPANFSDGNVMGFEIGFNQPFLFLPEPFVSGGVNLRINGEF